MNLFNLIDYRLVNEELKFYAQSLNKLSVGMELNLLFEDLWHKCETCENKQA
jgi:hypothetical protein